MEKWGKKIYCFKIKHFLELTAMSTERELASSLPISSEALGSDPASEYSAISSSMDTSAGDMDSELMDSLVRDVRRLSETLTELGIALEQPTGLSAEDSATDADNNSKEDLNTNWSVNVHQRLCDVLQLIKEAIIRYRFLQSNDIFEYLGSLVDVIKGLNFYEESPKNSEALKNARATLESLQIAVAECVGEYLTWEMTQYESSLNKMSWSAEDVSSLMMQNGDPPVAKRRQKKELRKQLSVGSEVSTKALSLPEKHVESEDEILDGLDDGVEIALSRARAWSNYCKELLAFIQRRINLDSEHARAVQKLNANARFAITVEVCAARSNCSSYENFLFLFQHFLPLKEVYLNNFKIENDFFENCLDTMKRLYEYKFIKPLEARKVEIDCKRKDLKHTWEKIVKEVETVTIELKKARHNVVIRESNYKKAKESTAKSEKMKVDSQKLERRRKLQEDALLRREQASHDYWSLEQRLEEKYQEMAKTKTTVLREVRELIYQCDQTTKACTVAYFQACSGLWALLPMQYQSLADTSRQYIPGTLYKQFVHNLNTFASEENINGSGEKSKVVSEGDLPVIQVNGDPITSASSSQRSSMPPSSSPSATTSVSTCCYSSDDVSSSHRIAALKPLRNKTKIFNRPSLLSDAALSHRLQRTRAPTKCCHCDAYTFFQTVQCTECGLTWHKTCLGNLDVHCQLAKQLNINRRRMRIFGVPLQKHLEDNQISVPFVLKTCIEELETRGLDAKGLYRVCGVKSNIEQICEKFERQKVELSTVLPTNIASIIKLYLRQLPEPLLTHELYHNFVELANKYPEMKSTEQLSISLNIITDLKRICNMLPSANYRTLKLLCLHLNRVSWFEMENQMSPTNLGIVFGPSLLWIDEGLSGTSLKSLLDAPLQTRVAELLIKYAYEIFDEDATEDMKRLCVKRRCKELAECDEADRRQVKSMVPSTSKTAEIDPALVEKGRHSTTPDLLRETKLVSRAKSLQSSLGIITSVDFTDASKADSVQNCLSSLSKTDFNVEQSSNSTFN
ncbi:Minor histocompatibility protein HA-1 [Trichinella nelsoni]|uniref:Minor histocompatibility protein HA-1 n=1 Tax=Trichinella nelsoni TaxID=6336 RepID=A0A0V0RK69_9BILA|nr:Minor histocompatibility protein HA-1 [Trichinella nelsoni]